MARYQTLKWKFYVIAYYITFFIRRLIPRHLTPFDWKFLKIGTLRAKDLKKSIQITKGRFDPCPAQTARNKGSFTTMVLCVVQRFLSSTVCALFGPKWAGPWPNPPLPWNRWQLINKSSDLISLLETRYVASSRSGNIHESKSIDFLNINSPFSNLKKELIWFCGYYLFILFRNTLSENGSVNSRQWISLAKQLFCKQYFY